MTENLLAIKRKSDNSFPIHEENPYTCNFLIKKNYKILSKNNTCMPSLHS